jgi:hypothetical protein
LRKGIKFERRRRKAMASVTAEIGYGTSLNGGILTRPVLAPPTI